MQTTPRHQSPRQPDSIIWHKPPLLLTDLDQFLGTLIDDDNSDQILLTVDEFDCSVAHLIPVSKEIFEELETELKRYLP